jgi:hypothetical protein
LNIQYSARLGSNTVLIENDYKTFSEMHTHKKIVFNFILLQKLFQIKIQKMLFKIINKHT